MAAHRIGESRLADMMIEQGVESTAEHASALLAYSRQMTEAVIARIPDGVYRFRDAMEGDGQREFEIPIQVQIEVSWRSHARRLRGQRPASIGQCQRRARHRPLRHLVLRPAAIRRRYPGESRLLSTGGGDNARGSFLNPRFPAAVVVGNTETSQRVVDTVLGALAQALPEVVPAASLGTMNNFTVGGFNGDEQFVYYETLGGGHGASSRGDGLSGRHCHMTNTLNTPVEALEYSLPMRVRRYHLRAGSGGEGAYRGGDGIVREYELLVPATVTINSERRLRQPYGVNGGRRASAA